MTDPRSHFDAHDEPPAVHEVEGELVLTGPNVDVAYTTTAARALAVRLLAVVDRIERAGG